MGGGCSLGEDAAQSGKKKKPKMCSPIEFGTKFSLAEILTSGRHLRAVKYLGSWRFPHC